MTESWRVQSAISSAEAESDAEVLISNSITRRRAALSIDAALWLLWNTESTSKSATPPKAQALVEEMKSQGFLTLGAEEQDTRHLINHWNSRNWVPALDYYLWSRQVDFSDSSADYAARQVETLTRYIEEDGLPAEPRAASEDAPRFEEFAPIPDISIGKALFRRTSSPILGRKTLKDSTLATILKESFAEVARARGYDIESDPRAAILSYGAALDVYFVAYDVDGLPSGFYFYDPSALAIERVSVLGSTELGAIMRRMLIGQEAPETASCTILFVVDFDRYQWRYRHERALRHLYVECGRIAQPLLLLATAYGYQTHISPAVRDKEMLEMLNRTDDDAQVMYTVSLG